MSGDRPEPQPLPRCYRHPHLPCPGECQYGPADVCLNDLGEPPPSALRAPLEEEP